MERLKAVREAANITQGKLAELLGVTSSFISQAERGDKDLSRDVLIRLRETLGISIDWFLTGEGQMYHRDTFEKDGLSERDGQMRNSFPFGTEADTKDKDQVPRLRLSPSLIPEDQAEPGTGVPVRSQAVRSIARHWGQRDVTVYKYIRGKTEAVEIPEPEPDGMVFVPIYSQTASAGPGQEPTQLVETENMAPVFYDVLGIHRAEHCGICRVVGDSMTDVTIANGDWVIFDRFDVKGDGIFVIGMFGETRVKRLQYRLADRQVIISSENIKRYPDPEIVGVDALERGELKIFGRVFSWIHKHPH